MRKLLGYFLFTNLFISLCAVALQLHTYSVLGVNYNEQWSLIAFTFFSTLFTYNFSSLNISGNIHSYRDVWISEHPIIIKAILLLSSLLIFSTIFFIQKEVIFLTLPLGVISVLYSYPVSTSNFSFRLNNIPVIKTFLLVIVWSLVTVVFPVWQAGKEMDSYLYRVFAENIFLLFALAISFDIRDIEKDLDNKTRTIPLLIGVNKARYLAGILLIMYCVIPSLSVNYLLAKVITAIIAGVLIIISERYKGDFFYSFFMDGVILLPFAINCLICFFK